MSSTKSMRSWSAPRPWTATEDAVDKLILLNHELFVMIESSISIDLLTRLLSTQLLARGEKHLLDRNRVYFKLLRQIIRSGQADGAAPPGPQRQRDREGLRPVGAGAALRLVPVQRGVLPGELRRPDHPHVPGKLPGRARDGRKNFLSTDAISRLRSVKNTEIPTKN